MSHNTDAMVQELRAEFESMLSYVKYSRSTTADQVERGLFRRLLNLGAHLMWLFLALRSERAGRERYQTPSGETLPYPELQAHGCRICADLGVWLE
jgi:hypothetical protein